MPESRRNRVPVICRLFHIGKTNGKVTRKIAKQGRECSSTAKAVHLSSQLPGSAKVGTGTDQKHTGARMLSRTRQCPKGTEPEPQGY